MTDRQTWETLGRQLRIDSIRASSAAGSGHPTSSMSAADLMAVLLDEYLRYDFDCPGRRRATTTSSSPRATPRRCCTRCTSAAGAIDDEELLTFRELGSRLQGHPTPELPWVDVATGSLGQGLPIAVGIALAGKRLDGCRTGSGCSAATASWPRARCGRPSSTPASRASTT